MWYHIQSCQVEKQLSKMKNIQGKVETITSEAVIATILDSETRQRLFPANKVLVFLQAYDVNEENIKYVLNLYGTNVYRIKIDEICTSLAFITSCPQKYNLRVHFEYYGDCLEDFKILFVQTLRHILSIGYRGDIYLVICYSVHMDGAKIKEIISEMCGWNLERQAYGILWKTARIKNFVKTSKL